MNKFLILIAVLLVMPLVSAELTFSQGEQSTISIPLSNEDLSSCYTCDCNMTITYPNGEILARNAEGLNNGGYCEYNITSDRFGRHGIDMSFTDGSSYGKTSGSFYVQIENVEENPGQSIMLGMFIVAGMILLTLLYFGGHGLLKVTSSILIMVLGIGILYLQPVYGFIGWIIFFCGGSMLLGAFVAKPKGRR